MVATIVIVSAHIGSLICSIIQISELIVAELLYLAGSKGSKEQAYGVANLCLEFTVSNLLAQNPDCLKEVTTMILPNILILPKVFLTRLT
jgi:hypothetical protein